MLPCENGKQIRDERLEIRALDSDSLVFLNHYSLCTTDEGIKDEGLGFPRLGY